MGDFAPWLTPPRVVGPQLMLLLVTSTTDASLLRFLLGVIDMLVDSLVVPRNLAEVLAVLLDKVWRRAGARARQTSWLADVRNGPQPCGRACACACATTIFDDSVSSMLNSRACSSPSSKCRSCCLSCLVWRRWPTAKRLASSARCASLAASRWMAPRAHRLRANAKGRRARGAGPARSQIRAQLARLEEELPSLEGVPNTYLVRCPRRGPRDTLDAHSADLATLSSLLRSAQTAGWGGWPRQGVSRVAYTALEDLVHALSEPAVESTVQALLLRPLRGVEVVAQVVNVMIEHLKCVAFSLCGVCVSGGGGWAGADRFLFGLARPATCTRVGTDKRRPPACCRGFICMPPLLLACWSAWLVGRPTVATLWLWRRCFGTCMVV